MNQDALTSLQGILNEFESCIYDLVFGVEQNLTRLTKERRDSYLSVVVEPRIGQIDDAYVLPMVWYLSCTAVNDMSHLVSHNKLEILRINVSTFDACQQ